MWRGQKNPSPATALGQSLDHSSLPGQAEAERQLVTGARDNPTEAGRRVGGEEALRHYEGKSEMGGTVLGSNFLGIHWFKFPTL